MNKLKQILIFLMIGVTLLTPRGFIFADEIEDLNDKISDKKSDIDAITKRIASYQKKIDETRKEASSLKNQLSILENQIAKIELDVDLIKQQIQKTNLEIQKINLTINETFDNIEVQKDRLAKLLQLIESSDRVSYFEILLVNNSFSEFFNHYQQLQEINRDIYDAFKKLKDYKSELSLQKISLEQKKLEEEKSKTDLEEKKQDLSEMAFYKQDILTETQKSERRFKTYVDQLKSEQQQINSDIITLEKKIRSEIEKNKEAEKLKQMKQAGFMWPVASRYLSARFHDPDYPYRYIFEHPAIDIRTGQSTPVASVDNGYVAKVKDGGAKGYSYIMIIHNGGFSSVYGHMSRLDVREDEFVNKGQIIGLSGGMPGTRGAGNLTTGPHLHFEIRYNGIPVNPLEHLPRDW